jgi:hypothetical protein
VSHKKNIENSKGDTLMWTEKYWPKTPDDIIENQSIVCIILDVSLTSRIQLVLFVLSI